MQKELEAARAIGRGFESLRKIEPPPDLLTNTRRQIEADKRAPAVPREARVWHFPAWGWPAAAAAIVLIGAGALVVRAQFAARQRERQAAAVAAASAPQLREALERAAAKNLPEPTLAAAQIDLPAPPDKIGERADEVLRIAFAESAALFGFVGFFAASVWWVYPAGAAITFAGFARAAPTRARLHRDQDRLNEQGCFRSLIAALAGQPPAPRPGR